MSYDLSKEVTDRWKASLLLRAAITEQGPEVAAAALGRGDASDDSLAPFRVLSDKLGDAIDQAVAFDRALHDLRSEQAALRRERDAAKRGLGRQLVGLRRLVRGSYETPDLVALGLDAANPKEPRAFLRQAELILDKLGAANLRRWLGKPLFRQPQDPAVHREDLRSSIAELRRTLDELVSLKRRLDSVLVKKHRALKAYDPLFLTTARMFEDLCRFAGYDELAERVRPSTRDPGRTARKDAATDGFLAAVLFDDDVEPPDVEPPDQHLWGRSSVDSAIFGKVRPADSAVYLPPPGPLPGSQLERRERTQDRCPTTKSSETGPPSRSCGAFRPTGNASTNA